MVDRAFSGTQRPPLPQRSFSGTGLQQPQSQLPNRPNLPSRLSNVRSISQPVGAQPFALPTDPGTARGDVRNRQAYASNMSLGSAAAVGVQRDVIDLEAEDEGPPAKRTKLAGGEYKGKSAKSIIDLEEQHQGGIAYETIPGDALPLPPRPSTQQRANSRRKPIPASARHSKDLSPPTMATRLPAPKHIADFSPWTGTHPEDTLNEGVIKLGYFDKPPPASHSESNTAKATLWTNLSQRNNFGLQTLSHLFVQVMEKRQAQNRCTAAPTFKPPPRVTVTDTKREAWLRDLANLEVPLRKQSRTIPHGIRGKLLMEQCLSKQIPLPRAVWLAKCVGANELRAFRRKGISAAAVAQGEQKWVREWTVQLELFLEAVLANFGTPGWKLRVDYSVRLATRFYGEGLLEREHYLDWVVGCFCGAALDTVPAWTGLVQLYLRDIVSCGRRGRQLAEGVLRHLQEVTEKEQGAFGMLKLRLQNMVAVLAVTAKTSLILPRVWEKYEALLAPAERFDAAVLGAAEAVRRIRKRNERLVAPLCQTSGKARSPLLDLVGTLDAVGLDVDMEKLAQTCLGIMPDTSSLVSALLDWASTIYRQGTARIYLAARLVAHVKHTGADTDSSVLHYLTTATPSTCRVSNLYELIADLVRLDSFSVGRYLQWLITSGAIASGKQDSPDVGLLAALPAENLAVGVKNIRKTLLMRMGKARDEREEVDAVMHLFDSAVVGTRGQLAKLETTVSKISGAATKQALRQSVLDRVQSDHKGPPSFALFCAARTVLEQLHALSDMTTLLTHSLRTDDPALLFSVADTTNRHAQALAALGTLNALLDGLTSRYRSLRSQQPLDRTFILSLTNLTSRIPGKAALFKLLADDLAICEQQNSQAACSPASDSLVGMQAGGDLESDEEIDRVFASGNVMDEGLMHRMFGSVISKASRQGGALLGTDEARSKVCGWLGQLKAVDATTFSGLVKAYLARTAEVVGKGKGQDGWAGTRALVASDCLTLQAVVRSVELKLTAHTAAAVLDLVAGPIKNTGLSVAEEYKLQLQQQRYCAEHPLQAGRQLAAACSGEDFDPTGPRIAELLMQSSITAPGTVLSAFQALPETPQLRANSHAIVDAILRPRDNNSTTNTTPSITTAEQVVSLATELSLPYCSDAFRYLRASTSEAGTQDISTLKEALLNAIARGSSVWPQLLESVEPHVQAGLHEWAKEHLLSSVDADAVPQQEKSDRYMSVLDVTASAVAEQERWQTVTTIAEKLAGLEKQLPPTPAAGPLDQGRFWPAIGTLLHLCTLQISCLPATDAAANALVQLLVALTTLFLHPSLQPHPALLERVHEVAAALSDNLPAETLVPLTQRFSPHEPRLRSFLPKLSQSGSQETWLALVSRVPSAAAAAAAAAGLQAQGPQALQPQQQRPQMRSTPQQQQRVPSQSQLQPPQSGQTSRSLSALAPSGLGAGIGVEVKTTPFALRRWEIMPDPTPVMGENDCSLSLQLFGARKV